MKGRTVATITIDLDSPVPLADQLLAALQRAIARREVAVGESLPAVRQLAADLGIHFNTVARAYRELERQGLVRSVRGRGTVVTADRATSRDGRRGAIRRLKSDLREILTRAKLEGLERRQVEDAFRGELGMLWEESSDE